MNKPSLEDNVFHAIEALMNDMYEDEYKDLIALLMESCEALKYAADITTPESQTDCNCKICTVLPKLDYLLRRLEVKK